MIAKSSKLVAKQLLLRVTHFHILTASTVYCRYFGSYQGPHRFAIAKIFYLGSKSIDDYIIINETVNYECN